MDADALSVLLHHPDRADALDRSDLVEVVAQAARLQATALALLLTTPPSTSKNGRPVSDTEAASGDDRLLTVDEAAERLGVDSRWIYRKADSLPFTRRLGERTLRFSEKGMERWLKRR